MFIHLVVIAWLYVALMMAVAEAASSMGSVIGGVFTFLAYGVLPVALVVYLLATPARRRRRAAQEAAERQAAAASSPPASDTPDGGGEAPADTVAPVREKE